MFEEVEDLRVYQVANDLAEEVWQKVRNWDYFNKQTIGKQIMKAVDSIAANIAEGFGRYHMKDVINFLYYARGSLYETKCWLGKARRRALITETRFQELSSEINSLAPKLNAFIGSKKSRLKGVQYIES